MGITVTNKILRENRARFSPEELRVYDRQWVAFNADGSRIVAHASEIAELAVCVLATGESLNSVVIERIEFDDDSSCGGAELS